MFRWLDNISYPTLIVAALLLGLAPFLSEPHLWGKLKMLTFGELTKPLDIFDLFFHGSAVLLLMIKTFRSMRNRTKQ